MYVATHKAEAEFRTFPLLNIIDIKYKNGSKICKMKCDIATVPNYVYLKSMATKFTYIQLVKGSGCGYLF